MSTEREVDVDLSEDGATAVVTERRKLTDLFNEDGELRLWQDSEGWSGFIREFEDGEPVYFSVNTRFDEDEWIRKLRCGQKAVREKVQSHIEDKQAGGAGNFKRRCSPP